jgi:HSP90 family molecular chaperone
MIKLYVKRIFISDKFEDLLPSWLNFLRGIVDSDDLPLNVSREILQKSKILQSIQRKLVRKIIAMFQSAADDEENQETWQKFHDNYSQLLKVGIIKDVANRARIAKLVRWYSATSPEKQIGFEDYVKNMKEGQKDIYYLGGEVKEMMLNSPHLGHLVKRGYDVLLFSEPIDEYLVANMQKYDKYNLVDITKEGLNLDEDKDILTKYKEEFTPLVTYLKDILSETVQNVEVSTRLSSSPCALVSTSWQLSANMERIMKARPLAADKAFGLGGKKILEINPRHPIIKQLLVTVERNQQTDDTKDLVNLMYDTAVITSGYALSDPIQVGQRLNKIIAQSLGVDPAASVEEDKFTEKSVQSTTETDEGNEEL